MKRIPLSNGFFALVDDSDYEMLSKYRWNAPSRHGIRYARTTKGIMMHRIILNAKKGQIVDHKNGNGLDNRRENIRICTYRQNQHNKIPRDNKLKGIYKVFGKNQWRARIRAGAITTQGHSNKISLGYFDSPIEAARAYDIAAITYFGEFAATNFSRSEYEDI